MNEQHLSDIWQVEVGGQVYEASFAELGEWVSEGSLHPEDKVRKGNLRWIEARKIPALVPFFNAKASGKPMPVVVSTTDAAEHAEHIAVPVNMTELPVQPETSSPIEANFVSSGAATPAFSQPVTNEIHPDVCVLHSNISSVYLCDGCGSGFCKGCPKSYGGSVKICPMCGAMCRPVDQVQQKNRQEAILSNALNEGFGMADFFNAIAYPFRFKTSLFFGALMFMFFSIGQSATALGGILMFAAAIICFMLANMLTFGVLANTVENFAQGKLESNFMPSFDDFSLWDDVVHPFFLSIAVYITSFGPFIATLIIGIYLVVSSVTSQMNTFQSEIEKLPGTDYYAGRKTVEQSKDVKKVLGDISNKQNERLDQYNQAATGNSNAFIDQDAKEQEELWAAAQQSRKAGLESALGKTPETREKEYNDMVAGLLKLAAPLVVIGAITFLWGLFYFSAACAVAGYTRSFVATINPLVGLDTIKRLGLSYVKIMLMGFVLLIASAIVSGLFAMIFAPFNLPGMGNLPAKAVGALFGFYLSVVFACVLGYALFKNSDKLQLLR